MAILTNELSQWRQYKPAEVKIINNRPVQFRDICVHEFGVGDVEDPDLYAAQPIWEWQQSEAGQWIMANAVETPYFVNNIDYNTWGQRFKIMARLSEQNQTFWSLKWGGNKK